MVTYIALFCVYLVGQTAGQTAGQTTGQTTTSTTTTEDPNMQALFPTSVPYPMQIEVKDYEVYDAIFETLDEKAKDAVRSAKNVILYYLGEGKCVFVLASLYPDAYVITPPGEFDCKPMKPGTGK